MISAVEALCQKISGNSKATLGDALNEIKNKKNIKINPALQSALEKLYGYTSGPAGIRHALADETIIEQEDAKFMLVSCSAFVNYLTTKASRTVR